MTGDDSLLPVMGDGNILPITGDARWQSDCHDLLLEENCHHMNPLPITGEGSQGQKGTQQEPHDSGSEHVVTINVELVYIVCIE